MEEIEICYLGQCGFLLQNNTCHVAIDPVLNGIIEDGVELRHYPPVMEPEELEVDYLLCTHGHIDHLAEETVLPMMKTFPNLHLILPAGCIPQLLAKGVEPERMTGLNDKETVEFLDGAFRVTGLSTAHPIHQLDEEGRDISLAFAVEMGGQRLVHLGDTYATERLMNGLKSLGDIQVFFPPINGRDEEREKKGIIGNLSPEEAAAMAVELKAGITIPTHFDMIIGNTENPENFVKALMEIDAKAKYYVPVLKESITV